ncbi:MAG: metallophosphoesterase [Lachnospiraceae bacterium]|nr:metallophosphoesterase [Lachnospiraceae bacterium]
MSKLVVKEYDCLAFEEAQNCIKIAFLSDLHGASYKTRDGKDRITEAVRRKNPDMVIAGGDMIIGIKPGKAVSKAKLDSSISILTDLAKDFKVYHAIGNHEERLEKSVYDLYFDALKKAGVEVLDDSFADIKLEGGKVMRMYGLSLPYEYYPKFKKKELSVSVIERLLHANRVSGGIKNEDIRLLLAHNPNYADAYEEFGADITLSGHLHGGVVRLFNRGLIGPDFKLFPRFSGGSYMGNHMNLFVSCGLGEHVVPFRINDPYEIMIINVYY